MVVEIKKKGQQNYPVQLTFRFSSFFFTVSFVEGIYFLFVYPSLVYLKWVQISTCYLLRSGQLFYDEVQCSE